MAKPKLVTAPTLAATLGITRQAIQYYQDSHIRRPDGSPGVVVQKVEKRVYHPDAIIWPAVKAGK